jgi:hypothetical protein
MTGTRSAGICGSIAICSRRRVSRQSPPGSGGAEAARGPWLGGTGWTARRPASPDPSRRSRRWPPRFARAGCGCWFCQPRECRYQCPGQAHDAPGNRAPARTSASVFEGIAERIVDYYLTSCPRRAATVPRLAQRTQQALWCGQTISISKQSAECSSASAGRPVGQGGRLLAAAILLPP